MLNVEVQGPVARVTLNLPSIHNALNGELIALLTRSIQDLGKREDVRAIVLGGTGKSFSAGADLNWMQRVAAYSREENLEDARKVAEMFLSIAKCPRPTIARVHGAALGGGAGLVAACDIAVAVESAQFGFTEVKVGIVPATISPFVIARIGSSRAREYFLTGERFPASVALDMGLIQHVASNESEMDAVIARKIAEILTAAPGAIAQAKELIFGVAGRPIDSCVDFTADVIARARASAEGQAGMKAFLSRSRPPWSNG
jgi:methylglutaconyl-CoA hydratase